MLSAITPYDRPAPAPGSSDFGALRALVLDAAALGRPAMVPRAVAEELSAWATGITAAAQGTLRGLGAADVPERWYDLLAWAGVPMSPVGEMRWGRDLREAAVPTPEFIDDNLVLPPPATMAQLTSLALKPLRLLVSRRLGCRLQAATGLHLYLWANQAVLISRAEVPLGGFLHGPEPGQRHSLSVEPGSFQVVRW